jgi:hypothetical protein
VPKNIRSVLRIVMVDTVDEVLREALKLEHPEDFFRTSPEVSPTPS